MKFLDLMQRLIAANSVSAVDPQWDNGNLEVIELLANLFGDLGFKTEIMPMADPRKANLIATYGSGPGGLVLSGHTDTVPCDDSLWQQSPFQLTERDNKLFGLGTCDMKGFFAVVHEAITPLLDQPFKQPLVILATADEESSMCGAQAVVDADRVLGKRAIIGEPTGLCPVHMHKGIMIEQLVITGHSGHSSNPGLGRNAMETMADVLNQLLRLRDDLRQQKHPGFAIDYPTMNLGYIKGGDNPNRICGCCELGFEIRPLPGMDIHQLHHSIEQQIARAAARDNVEYQLDAMIVPPFAAAPNSETVALCEQLTGKAAESVAFATEAPYLAQLGMDVTVIGPGSIDQAHQPDEFLALDAINPGVKFIREMVRRSCL